MVRNTALFLFLVLTVAQLSLGQHQQQDASASAASSSSQTTPSLADIAKEAKKRKDASQAHATKVVTNEDLGSSHGPLPAMEFNGDNSADVLAAIDKYRASHTPKETEEAIRQWYDEYDSVLAAAIKQNDSESSRRNDTIYNGYWGCQDSPNYQNCVVRRRAETRGLHDDRWAQQTDGFTAGHIQSQFMAIRNGMYRFGLHYDWFKVRQPGGGSF